jgi:hypothetical protein
LEICSVLLAEFGGKGDRISEDELGDGKRRRKQYAVGGRQEAEGNKSR